MQITTDIPGGNAVVLKTDERSAALDIEMRDSAGDWFYWKFQVEFSEPGEYVFSFARPGKIGTRGPAASYDHGISWRWLDARRNEDTQEFRYSCTEANETVWFCQCMPYLETDFARFAREFSGNSDLKITELCRSRQNRPVELVEIAPATAPTPAAVLLTCRHHAQESMASFVLEGIFRAALSSDAFGTAFRRELAVYAVPFVDKDGVENGDQGKNRRPFDHARDYADEKSIYPETAAIKQLLNAKKPFFILDLHCPMPRSQDGYEAASIIAGTTANFTAEMKRFSQLLEVEAPAEAPYCESDNLEFGIKWNTWRNYRQGVGLRFYGERPWVRFSQTIEIPFANFGEHTATPDTMRAFGAAIARALLRYYQLEQKTLPQRW